MPYLMSIWSFCIAIREIFLYSRIFSFKRIIITVIIRIIKKINIITFYPKNSYFDERNILF